MGETKKHSPLMASDTPFFHIATLTVGVWAGSLLARQDTVITMGLLATVMFSLGMLFLAGRAAAHMTDTFVQARQKGASWWKAMVLKPEDIGLFQVAVGASSLSIIIFIPKTSSVPSPDALSMGAAVYLAFMIGFVLEIYARLIYMRSSR